METTEAYETLGVWLAADGNHTKELDILKGFAKEWVDCIRVSFLSESEAVRAMSTTIIKKLEYPVITSETRQRCILDGDFSKQGVLKEENANSQYLSIISSSYYTV